MAIKDILQSQKTIRELRTEATTLRLEKEQAQRDEKEHSMRVKAVEAEAGRVLENQNDLVSLEIAKLEKRYFEAMRPMLLSLPTARAAIEKNPTLLAKDMIGLFQPLEDFCREMGLARIGEVGAIVPYDPALHDSSTVVATRSEVRVTTVGYRKDETILIKARVKEE